MIWYIYAWIGLTYYECVSTLRHMDVRWLLEEGDGMQTHANYKVAGNIISGDVLTRCMWVHTSPFSGILCLEILSSGRSAPGSRFQISCGYRVLVSHLCGMNWGSCEFSQIGRRVELKSMTLLIITSKIILVSWLIDNHVYIFLM